MESFDTVHTVSHDFDFRCAILLCMKLLLVRLSVLMGVVRPSYEQQQQQQQQQQTMQ